MLCKKYCQHQSLYREQMEIYCITTNRRNTVIYHGRLSSLHYTDETHIVAKDCPLVVEACHSEKSVNMYT